MQMYRMVGGLEFVWLVLLSKQLIYNTGLPCETSQVGG
jgi:hypothetical protein